MLIVSAAEVAATVWHCCTRCSICYKIVMRGGRAEEYHAGHQNRNAIGMWLSEQGGAEIATGGQLMAAGGDLGGLAGAEPGGAEQLSRVRRSRAGCEGQHSPSPEHPLPCLC